MQTCTNIDCTLSSAVRRREEWGEQSEARLWKTSLQVISVSRVVPVGLRARRDRCCSHPLELIATPHSLLSKSLPFSAKSPVSLCSPSIFLPIAIHCFLRLHFWFTILCLCGAPFNFFISDIHYSRPIPLLLSHCAMIAQMHL